MSTQATISLEPPFAADPRGMGALIDGIPEQTERALGHSAAYPWKLSNRIPSVLAVGAMGGSAIAAELTAGLHADHIPRPIFVVRDYHWPAFLTREAFALLGSYSGATEETLSLYQDAARRGVPRAAITTGGALASMCDRDGVPWCKLPLGMPPRAAMFSSWVPLTMLLAALEWCDDPTAEWRRTVEALRELRETIGTAVPEEKNSAKQLARSLVGRRIYLYSATERMWAVGFPLALLAAQIALGALAVAWLIVFGSASWSAALMAHVAVAVLLFSALHRSEWQALVRRKPANA